MPSLDLTLNNDQIEELSDSLESELQAPIALWAVSEDALDIAWADGALLIIIWRLLD
uniref:Uncharacterized protein n=1 Tax=Romanomermis culicivorax TaxID=13658 RepID=A0A915IIE2_ROMCU